jgi:hypothetical protein
LVAAAVKGKKREILFNLFFTYSENFSFIQTPISQPVYVVKIIHVKGKRYTLKDQK